MKRRMRGCLRGVQRDACALMHINFVVWTNIVQLARFDFVFKARFCIEQIVKLDLSKFHSSMPLSN